MNNCQTCANAIFDAKWGDFFCTVKEHTMYLIERPECEDYKNGTPKESKANADYEANLYDS